MALKGKGMLIVLNEVRARDEADFNEWYNREHIDERVNLPGFRRARRYVADGALKGDPKFLATYECGKVTDLSAPGYVRLLANQSPWSKRVMRRFTKFTRLTLKLRVDLSHGVGGAVTLVRFVPDPKRAAELARWLKGKALPAAIRMPGVVGACALQNDLGVMNAAGPGYPKADRIEWAVLIEGGDGKATAAAARARLSLAALKPFGVARAPAVGSYRLIFGNDR